VAEDQGPALRADVEFEHAAQDEKVVAGRVAALEEAVEPGERAGDDRCAGGRVQSTPSNLLPPDRAKPRHRSSCSSPRTFTQKAPTGTISGQVVDVRAGRKPTSGGSSETETNDPTVSPTGPCRVVAVTTATPVGTCPITYRNRSDVNASTTGRRIGVRTTIYLVSLFTRTAMRGFPYTSPLMLT
jgi:hypothetical protein